MAAGRAADGGSRRVRRAQQRRLRMLTRRILLRASVCGARSAVFLTPLSGRHAFGPVLRGGAAALRLLV
jgi:hypothetical protein